MINQPCLVLDTTVLFLWVLATYRMMWQKSITTYIVLSTFGLSLVMSKVATSDIFQCIYPYLFSVMLFVITLRTIFKSKNDRFMGSLIW